jgi:putative PIN family toxin of toxin-antitoxin system
MRIVMDTGVVVSAVLLPRSVPRQAFDAATRLGKLLISDESVGELDEVLRRAKFDKYVPSALRLEFLAALVQSAAIVEIEHVVTGCRDPRDDKFLSLAVNGQADFLVSGDQDLLVLNPFQGIAIVTPAEFLARFAPSE